MKNPARILTLFFVLACFIFAGCDCDENSPSNELNPAAAPRTDKDLLIEGPLPDMTKGGGVAFAPSQAAGATEFSSRYIIIVVDRDDPTQTRELAPVTLNGNMFSMIIPISSSRVSPLIIIKEKENGKNLLLATPGRVPAYKEVPSAVRRITVRGMTVDPKSTARSLLAIAKNVNPDMPIITISGDEETAENIIREIKTNEATRFDTIIENNVGGRSIVDEFSKAVQTVTTILASPAISADVKNELNQALGNSPDASTILGSYVAVLNSENNDVIRVFNESNLPRSVQLSETVIDARSSDNAVRGVIQNTIDEPIDTTPPAIEFASISPSAVKAGESVFVELRASEPLISLPFVRILGRTAAVTAVNELSFRAALTVNETDTDSVSFIIEEVYDKYGNKGANHARTTDGSASIIDKNTAVMAPEISIPGGNYDSTISVTLKTASEKAIIKYTLDGSLPSADNGTVYTSPIIVAKTALLKAVSIIGKTFSGVSSAAYKIDMARPKVSAPVFNPLGSTYYATQSVSLSSATPGAIIKYTLDGTKPSETIGTVYERPFGVSSSLKALAIAYKDGMETSDMAVAVYTIEAAAEKVQKPLISLASGAYDTTQSVSLSSATAGAAIIYTLDGTLPSVSNGSVYSGPFNLIKSCVLKAVATKAKMLDSEVVSASYSFDLPLAKVSKPVLTPAGCTFENEIIVKMSTDTPGAYIYYTLDGTKPSSLGIRYSNPFSISTTLTVTAVAVKSDMLDSDAASETYTNVNTAAMPIFSVNGGEYKATQSVTLTSKTEGASIYYTLNGSAPSVVSGILYSGTIEVSSNVTIKAIAVKEGMRDSQVAAAEYTITIPELPQVSAPEFKPAAAAYNSTLEIEISCATTGATIYYTIDGTVPSKDSIKYIGPVEAAKSVTIKAIAIKAGMKDSLAAEVKYVIVFPVSPPVFKPVGGSVYTSTQEIELICATPGATIYYTIDGGVPTKAGLKYENPVTVSKTTTIKAFAVKDGMADSEISEARYPIRFPVAEPAFSFAGGTYETTLEVTITTSTEGARIYYTLDGTTPSAANGTLYSSPLQITRPLDIKAVAVKDEMGDSAVIAAAYVVPTETVSAPAISPNGGFFFSQTQVTITCATSDAEIYYTLDGTAPSKLSAKYASPFMINKFGKFSVKAVAYKSGMFDSPVSEPADFTIAVPPLPQADLTKVTIDKMQGENKMCLKNVTTSMEYSIDATGPTAGVTWKTGTGADIPLEFPGAPELGAPKANAPSYGGGADTSPYIVVRDKNYTNRLRGLGRYNSLPLSNSSSSDHSWSLDALSAKIVHGKPNYGNSADFKLYLYVGTTASNGTPVGAGYQLGDVASGNRTSIPIPSSDKASWTAADYFSFYLKNANNTADDTSDDYYYAICTPVKVSAGPDMANNTAAALVNAADGGAYAPAGSANIDGGDKGVTLRPGLSLSANESVILKVVKVNTILAEASSSANGVTPIFGGNTANVTYSGDIVAASGGKLNFNVDSRAIGAGSDVSVAAAKKDSNGNISLAGAEVIINYSTTRPPAPSNLDFAGLNNNGGILKMDADKAIGTGSGTLIVFTDNDGIFDSTNTTAKAKTPAAQNFAAAGASYSFTKTMAGADYVWAPADFAGKFVGYAVLDEATGNISAVSFDGIVPAAPDGADYAAGDLALLNLEYQNAANLRLKSTGNLSQAGMKVLATANGGTNWHELGATDASNVFSASGNNLPVAQYTSASIVKYAYKNATGNVSAPSNQDGEVVTVSKFGGGNIAIGTDCTIKVYFTGSGAKVLANVANAQNIVTVSTVKSGAVITLGTNINDFAQNATGVTIDMNVDVSVHVLDRRESDWAWKAHADANNIVSVNGGHVTAPASSLKGVFIQWSALGTGFNTEPNSIVAAPGGILYAGGQFTPTVGYVNANHVAKWNGTSWSSLIDSGNDGITGGNVSTLAYDSANNILYAGGDFSQAGGKPAQWLAKWSEITSTWSAVGGAGGPDNTVRCLLTTPGGTLYAGGDSKSGSTHIWQYDSLTGWKPVGGGTNGGVFAMAYDQTNNVIYVGGEFTECYNSGSTIISRNAARWNIGSQTWEALGTGIESKDVKSIAIDSGGAVYFGGLLYSGGGGYINKWHGNSWSSINGVNDEVKALAFDNANNILYAGGSFSSIGGVSSVSRIAQCDLATNTWSKVGAGMGGGGIYTLAVASDGTLYAGGFFYRAGEVTSDDILMNRIAKR